MLDDLEDDRDVDYIIDEEEVERRTRTRTQTRAEYDSADPFGPRRNADGSVPGFLDDDPMISEY